MRNRLVVVLASCISILLKLLSSVNSLTLTPPHNRAGLPYPEEGYRGDVQLKEASVTLDINSSWSEIPGHARLYSFAISHKARYVFENRGNFTVVELRIPVAARGSDLTFKLDGLKENHTRIEHVQEIDPYSGATVDIMIYIFSVPFSAQAQRTIEVNAKQFGARASQYFYWMKNASRWMKPIEEFSVVLNLRNAEFKGSTINPTTQRTDGATWNITNLTPSSDLVLYWQIRDPPQSINLTLVAIIIVVAAVVTIVGLKKWLHSSSSSSSSS